MPTIDLDTFVLHPPPRNLSALDPTEYRMLFDAPRERRALLALVGGGLTAPVGALFVPELDLFSWVFLGVWGLFFAGIVLAGVRNGRRKRRSLHRLLCEGRVLKGHILEPPPLSSAARLEPTRQLMAEVPHGVAVQQVSLAVPMVTAAHIEPHTPVLLLHHPSERTCIWVFPDGFPPVSGELWFDVTNAAPDGSD